MKRSLYRNIVGSLCGVIIAVIFLSVSLLNGPAEAKDLAWDRNAEADMKEYTVLMCSTSGCTPADTVANTVATVPQPATVTAVPKWTVPADMVEGTFAVVAVDKSGNRSGLSVFLPFDLKPPAPAANLRLQ